MRHARERIRHLCASCSSSPFSVPPRTRPACARGGGARSLARSLDCARAVWRWRWRWRWRWVTPCVMRVRVTHNVRHTRIHMSSMCIARVMAVFRSPRARSIGTRAWRRRRRSLARSPDRAHAVWRWRWRWRWRSVTPRVHASRTLHDPCATRARACIIYVRRVRHHRFPPPPAHDRHARVAAALARSLA